LSNFQPISDNLWETIQDRTIVTTKWTQEIVCAPSNRDISDNIAWPLKIISVSCYCNYVDSKHDLFANMTATFLLF